MDFNNIFILFHFSKTNGFDSLRLTQHGKWLEFSFTLFLTVCISLFHLFKIVNVGKINMFIQFLLAILINKTRDSINKKSFK